MIVRLAHDERPVRAEPNCYYSRSDRNEIRGDIKQRHGEKDYDNPRHPIRIL
jgi:hypothetical protein